MKHCLTKSRSVSLMFAGHEQKLTLEPMTFGKLIDIDAALGDGKDLSIVLKQPSPYDLAVITYCLLDDDSKKMIDDADLQINSDSQQTNPTHKLFYLIGESNIAEGLTNYTSLIYAVVELVKDSVGEESKKKTLNLPFILRSKKFTTP